LTSESKYTTTLTIEQPNYGRESQPINFGQDVPESVKKSSYVEPAPATHHSQVQAHTTYGQPGVNSSQYYGTNAGVVPDYGQVATKLSQTHVAGGQTYGTSHLATSGLNQNYGQTYGAHQTHLAGGQTSGTGHLATSGLNQNYGQNYGAAHQTYGVAHQTYGIPAGNLGTSGLGHQAYNVTSIHHSSSHTPTHGGTVAGGQKDYSHEADELTRRIAERLNQSKSQF
jgi:hypothetical protein